MKTLLRTATLIVLTALFAACSSLPADREYASVSDYMELSSGA